MDRKHRIRTNKWALVAMAFLAMAGVNASAQIQYTDFGPATLTSDNPIVFVTGLNQFISFGWAQPVPSVRSGLMEFTGTGVSVLTDGGGAMVVLDEDETIDANAGNWTAASGILTLWERSIFTGFNSSYLQPNNVGIIPLRFEENAQFFYGWVEITSIAIDGASYVVSAFAFNSQPDAPILAGETSPVIPEPSTLAMMLCGGFALLLARRRA